MKYELHRINTLWFLFLGGASICGALLIYYLILQSAVGAFTIREAFPMQRAGDERVTVALLDSRYTRNAYRVNNPREDSTVAWHVSVVESWRRFLSDPSRRLSYDILSDEQIERGLLNRYRVLILPSSLGLSDLQVQRIGEFMDQGGSVWATWTPGIYREDGTWRGWSVIEELFGVRFTDYIGQTFGSDFQVYTDTFPGVAVPGMYLTRPLGSSQNVSILADTTNRSPAFRRMAEEAMRITFPPLTGYFWADTLGTEQPNADFARVDTVTTTFRDLDGNISRRRGVAISYHTFVGTGRVESQMPYPYTSGGIRRITLSGHHGITAGIFAGYRAKIQTFTPGIRMEVVQDWSVPFATWYDYAVDSEPAEFGLRNNTAAVYGQRGEGRFVFLGFQRAALFVDPNDPEDFEALGLLFSNTLRYLQREALLWTYQWPAPFRQAAMLAGVSNRDVDQLATVADVLETERVKGSFFVYPPRAFGYSSTLIRLLRRGDVGVYGPLRTYVDGSPEEQTTMLTQWRNQLSDMMGGEPVRGYRPMGYGTLGSSTMNGLVRARFETSNELAGGYFLPDSIGRYSVPKVVGFPHERLVRIYHTARSDSMVAAEFGTPLTLSPFADDMTRIEYEGGLYRLMYSTELMGQPENLMTLREIVRELKRRQYWIASGQEITAWWRMLRGIETEVSQPSPARVLIRLTNRNPIDVSNIALGINFGYSAQRVEITNEIIDFNRANRRTPIQIELIDGGRTGVLTLPRLRSQQSITYLLDLYDSEDPADARPVGRPRPAALR